MSRVTPTVRVMHATTVRPISTIPPAMDPPEVATRVRLDGERIVVDRLVIHDPALASFLAERPAEDRAALVERAVRIGLLALQDAGVTVNVDVVRAEFEKLMRQAESVNEKAALALEGTLRANFADGDGRLPRTLEKFLGDRGALKTMVDELFDEKKRDSAIGRIGTMLERYFDGDASKLAHLLDPTRLNSPMHADLARGAGDLLDRTGTEAGALLKSKKGDFVLSLDSRVARGCDVRVVIEAKDRPMSMRAMRDELREAKENR